MVEPFLSGVFTQAEGTDYAHPHTSLGIHVLSGLPGSHGNTVQPLCHTQTSFTVVLQHQFLLHLTGCIHPLVKRSPHVAVQFTGMSDKRLRLDNLYVAGLFIPKITENVGRRLQQLQSFVCLVLCDHQLDDQHDRLLHRDIGFIGQRELTKQLLQRILLGAVERSG